MKKLFIIIFSLIFITFARAEEISYFNLTGKIYNSIWEQLEDRIIKLSYDTETENVLLYYSGYLGVIAVELTPSNRTNLIQYMEKYLKWNKKAKKKKVTLEKKIGRLNIKIYFKFGDDWYSDPKVTVLAGFLSQNINQHQFTLSFGKAVSSSNEFISITPETLYFDYKEVLKLKKGIEENFIKKEIKKILNKKKMIDEEFK